MSRSLLISAVGLLCSFAGSSQATVRLPELLGDHMVLRQNAEVSLWGFACAGETVQVEASWGAKTQAVVNAQGYWRLKVKTPAAQPLSKGLHPETITFTSSQGNNVQVKDVLIGEVWLASGQSNMKMWLMPCYPPGNNGWYGEKFWSEARGGECLKAKRPGLRLFNVEQSPSTISQTDCRSAMPDHMPRPKNANGLLPDVLRGWQPCRRDSADRFSAVAYYFAAELQEKLDVPVGVVTSSYGGTRIESWLSADALRTLPDFAKFTGPAHNNPLSFAGSEACLFNGMIAPLTPMSWSGVIWYQGESNRGDSAARYGALMKLLILDWRKQAGDETLPFYFVRMPPGIDGVRAGQAAALALPQTGMVDIDDVADPKNVHPANKRDVGRRLARQALAKTYGHRERGAIEEVGTHMSVPREVGPPNHGFALAMPALDLGALVQPYDPVVSAYADEGYHCWDPQITKGDDSRYYLVYSRWRKKGGDWLTNSEICMAVSNKPAGPYKHLKVILTGRGPGHWDELMACNSKIKKFGDKYYLYYISSKSNPARVQIRNSQRSGVAVSSALTGPYEPLDAPIVEPSAPVNAVTVNPTVEQMPDGRYLMMLKGDKKPHRPTEPMGQRVEGLAIADKPTGPFVIRPELAIKDFDTEDAEMWWDAGRKKFFAVFHAHQYIGLIESADGLHWQPAQHPRVMEGNRLTLTNGTVLKTEQGPLQRPGVFFENGEPRVLCLAVPMKDNWHIVTVPLACTKPDRRGEWEPKS